jgi:hypothetical protein
MQRSAQLAGVAAAALDALWVELCQGGRAKVRAGAQLGQAGSNAQTGDHGPSGDADVRVLKGQAGRLHGPCEGRGDDQLQVPVRDLALKRLRLPGAWGVDEWLRWEVQCGDMWWRWLAEGWAG